MGCFLCGVTLGMLIEQATDYHVKKYVYALLLIMAVLLIVTSFTIPVLVTLEILKNDFRFKPIIMYGLLSNHFLMVLFIRFLPFLSGLLFGVISNKKERVN